MSRWQVEMAAVLAGATACRLSSGWPGRAVPKSLGHEEEDEEEAESDDDGDDPKYPSPAQRLHNGRANKRNEILAAQQEKRVHTQAVCSLVEEEDLGNGGTGQTLYGRDGKALDDAGNDERSVVGRQGAPDGRQAEQDDGAEIDGSLAPEDSGRRGYDAAQSEPQHVQARGKSDLGYRDMVGAGDVVEACGKNGRHAAADHAVEAQRQQGQVATELPPVERVIGRVFGLGLEDEAAVLCALLLRRASGAARCTARPRAVSRGQRRRRCARAGMLQTQGLVAVVCFGEEDDGACGHAIVPGTSSVCGSLSIPRFHLRRSPASFSSAEAAVVVAGVVVAASAGGVSLRQGFKLTMLDPWTPTGQRVGGKRKEQRAKRKEKHSVVVVVVVVAAASTINAFDTLQGYAPACTLGQTSPTPGIHSKQMISCGPFIFTAIAAV
ncbi:hypothetical protein HBI51_163990 [Parastagonospora nodorum]|nr:hypothetical protein HBI51_163990 [Parastagonospora nodorum]